MEKRKANNYKNSVKELSFEEKQNISGGGKKPVWKWKEINGVLTKILV